MTADPLGSISATVTSNGGPVVGATVTVTGGPRSIPTRTATTNASGIASFSGLPAGSGYTVTAAKGGQSAPNQSVSVSGGSTTNLTFDFPVGSLKAVVTWATVNVVGATVTLTGGPTGVSLSGTSDVNGEVLFSNIPAGSGYTMNAVKSGQTGTASPTVVGATTTTVPIAMPTVSLLATVTWVGANVTGAQVTLSGGPMSLSPISATTTGCGQVTFSNVPAGGGYTLAATKNGQTTTLTSQTFTTSPTTSVGIALPTGTIAVNAATWAGQPAGSATVTISGGPNSPTTYTGTTNASGVVSIVVPATTSTYPYTVSAAKNTGTGSATVTSGCVRCHGDGQYPRVDADWHDRADEHEPEMGWAVRAERGGDDHRRPECRRHLHRDNERDRRALGHRAGFELVVPVHGRSGEEHRLGLEQCGGRRRPPVRR